MSVRRVPSVLASLLAGLALTAAPLTLETGRLAVGDVAAFAKNGNGGGNGGGNGNGNGRGNGGGGSNASADSGNTPSGNAFGKSKATAATGEAQVDAPTAASASQKGPLHPSNLGRLNGFMHASPSALANASPNSAIGIVAQEYRAALEAYLGGASGETPPADETVDPALAAAAEVLARAANKPLSPEIVAAINGKLAAADPTNTELAALADPTSTENLEVAADIAAAAEAIQATETNQGLGAGLEEETAAAEGEAATGETIVFDETTQSP